MKRGRERWTSRSDPCNCRFDFSEGFGAALADGRIARVLADVL